MTFFPRRLWPVKKVNSSRAGTTMLVVLIAVVMISFACYSFVERVSIENRLAHARLSQTQARWCAQAAELVALDAVQASMHERQLLGGLIDNEVLFRGKLWQGKGIEQGYFAILSKQNGDTQTSTARYGMIDESSKLNLHAVLVWEEQSPGSGKAALMQLPQMTEPLAESLLDWCDSDANPRPQGWEGNATASAPGMATSFPTIPGQSSSTSLDLISPAATPSLPPNQVPHLLDELLLVPGIEREMLFGSDRNANFQVSPDEALQSQAVNSLGSQVDALASLGGSEAKSLQKPWHELLTLHSGERNESFAGEQRINLNTANLGELHTQLMQVFPQEWADYIVLYRQFGPGAENVGAGPGKVEIDLSLPASMEINSIYELIGNGVVVSNPGQEPQYARSPFGTSADSMAGYLMQLADRVTCRHDSVLHGRVNVNRAPAAVLAAVPNMPAELVTQIIESRAQQAAIAPAGDGDAVPPDAHACWLLISGVATLEQMQAISPFVSARGDVFRCQIAGLLEPEDLIHREEVVIDGTSQPPRVIFRKNWSRTGSGFAKEWFRDDVEQQSTFPATIESP